VDLDARRVWISAVPDGLNRHDLTDKEWERLRGFLPADPPRGGRRAGHRMVINGIFFRTGPRARGGTTRYRRQARSGR
jgi:transposase